MIGVFLETGLPSRQLLEVAFRALRPTLLQALTELVVALAIVLNGLTAKGLTVAIGGKVDDAQVYPQRLAGVVRLRGGNIQRHRKRESAVTVEQVGLPFDLIETGLLIATNAEGNQDAAMQGQQGDFIQSLKGHQALIIGHGPFTAEGHFDALIALIRLSGFANGAYRQLRRQTETLPHIDIDELLQLELVGTLLIKGHLGNGITRIVKGVHGLKKRAMLFWRWSQFQEHRLFHSRSIAHLVRYCQYPTSYKERRIPPRLERAGHPAADLVKLSCYAAALSSRQIDQALPDMWK